MQEAEDETFPFNLDEFVTVDEVGDEAAAPQEPLEKATGGVKRREPSPRHHSMPSTDPAAKRSRIAETEAPAAEHRQGETPTASSSEGEPQDRKEREAAAAALVTLDEVSEEEEDYPDDEEVQPGLAGVKDPEALVTVDEVEGGEGDMQALVTLDEIVDEEDGDGGESGACLPAEVSLICIVFHQTACRGNLFTLFIANLKQIAQ